MKTAVMIDGGFFRKRIQALYGNMTAQEAANFVSEYSLKHLNSNSTRHITANSPELYRIFYYDCPPMSKKLFHPYLQKQVDFEKTDLYKWMITFLDSLKSQRKIALRLGFLADSQAHFSIRFDITKKLCNSKMTWEDLKEDDFEINVDQKGVDMKIGLDIASMAYKKQVDQIILISGDSDFVPAAKLARREGIDFVLDPMWMPIKPDLKEHIDGLRTCAPKPEYLK